MSAILLDEQQREDAIRKLWELKLKFEKQFSAQGKSIKFDHLLKDEMYRKSVLAKLAQLKQKEISEVASELLATHLPGSLYQKQQQNSASDGNPSNNIKNLQKQYEDKEKLFGRKLLLWQLLSVFFFLAFVVSTAWHGYQWYELKASRVIVLKGNITEDTTWYANNSYVLEKIIYVEGGANLTIEAGTTIKGENGSALVITQEGQIFAKGSESAPIIFTSSKAPGSRDRGDWGGLVLLGSAPTNIENAHIEGISQDDARGYFGGQDTQYSCGVLEYVRVEFAGFEVYQDNELNGLTLGGCGSNTIVRNIHVHRSLDDGVEVFGGNVNLQNIVISGAGDDGFDWDMGWQGNVQFLVVQLHHDGGDNAFEGDSHEEQTDKSPRSQPNFYNVTLVGANSKQIAQRAILLREGSAGKYYNFLIAGFSKEAVDFRGDDIAELVANGKLDFGNGLFYSINDEIYFPEEENDDAGFDEEQYFSEPHRAIRFGLDPRLPANVYNVLEPDFTPFINSPALEQTAKIPQGEFWDEGANYLGAVRPGVAHSWMNGWTQFPSN